MRRRAEGTALGAWVPGLPEASVLDRYAELTGRMPAIVHWFSNWQRSSRDFDAAAAEAVRRRGALPMISWEPWDGLAAINRGEHDAYARGFARAIAEYGGPMLLRFAHEMNGRWIRWGDDAAAYRSAWSRLRSLFADEGAGQAAWVWSPHVVDRNARPFEAYYPGDEEVDWLALDGYNWGRSGQGRRWQSFDEIFAASYAAITALSPTTPLMLAEIACAEQGGDKAAWIRDAFGEAIPDRYPAIRAVVWFNEDKRGHADWRVESSPASLAAWRDVVADPRYAGESPVSFRRAQPREAGAIRELIVRSMGHWEHRPGYLEEARELMSLTEEDLERDEAWVVLSGERVVGFYRLSRAGASSAEIEEFHLEPPMIGRGIGRRMFAHACDRARTMGARWLVWTTDANSRGFYLHMGGEITGTEPSAIEGDAPLTSMRLDLQA